MEDFLQRMMRHSLTSLVSYAFFNGGEIGTFKSYRITEQGVLFLRQIVRLLPPGRFFLEIIPCFAIVEQLSKILNLN
jgi:hypothetical protein